jgi:pSer/pThr/pTyr-binding forkhead associated (FHA) protein
MSGDLVIRWSGGEKSFSPGTTVRIGRDPGGEVVLDNANVSRLHALVVHDGESWILRDQGSFQGTFRDGQAVTELALGPSQSVTLGAPQVGVRIEMLVGAETAPTRPRATATDSVDTVVPNRESRPGGALRDDVFDSATVVGGQSLRVECGGTTYQFSPGKRVTVGRDASADVVSTNPTVSRTHAAITHDGEGWLIEDTGSAAGTFIDGKKIQKARLTGSTAVWLGDPETGERLVIVTSGEKESSPIARVRKLSRSRWLGVTAAATAVVAIGVAVIALNSQDNSSTLDRDQLARGVVRIETSEGLVGSGTVVDAELGLILTSAHVVAPRAPGQGIARDVIASQLGDDPRTIEIWVSDGLDQIAEPRYIAEVETVDGYLDLAVVRITETIGGSLIEEGDLDGLVAIPIGNASSVESGDPIQILGHPTVAQSNAATLTTGVLAGPVQDTRIGSNRAYINLDAQIRPGNSGGLVADSDGRIIGVPTLNWIEDSSNIGAMRPIDLAADLLEKARTGDPYVSPYFTLPTGEEDFPSLRAGYGADIGFRDQCTSTLSGAEIGDRILSLAIDYTGFVNGEHQDLAILITEDATGERIGFTSTAYDWPVEFDGTGCITVAIQLDRAIAAGDYSVHFFLGPNYEPSDLSFSFEF